MSILTASLDYNCSLSIEICRSVTDDQCRSTPPPQPHSCSGALLHFDPSLPKPVPAVLGSGIDHCVGVLVDPSDGSLLYLTNLGNAAMPSIIGKVQYGTAVPATITMSPANQKVLVGAAATFVASGAGSPNLSYQWFVASADAPGVFTPIPGATGATYTTDALDISANGNQYRCTVTNALRTDTSAVASLAVLVGSLPVPVIDLPLNLSTYIGGTVINFAGHATDVDDGNLPASSLSWLVRFGHEDVSSQRFRCSVARRINPSILELTLFLLHSRFPPVAAPPSSHRPDSQHIHRHIHNAGDWRSG